MGIVEITVQDKKKEDAEKQGRAIKASQNKKK